MIEWANNNEGFISFLALCLAVVVAIGVLGIIGSLFKWIWQKIKTRPKLFVIYLRGAAYPQEIIFEIENISDSKIILYSLIAKTNVGDIFINKTSLPLVLSQNKEKIILQSQLRGENKGQKELILELKFGFPDQKMYTKKIKKPMGDSGTFKCNEGNIV
jgi:hypothetical protein